MFSRIIEEDLEFINKNADLSFLSGKSVFIAGANGLIASYIVESIAYFNKMAKEPCTIFGIYRSDSDRLNHVKDEHIILSKRDASIPFKIVADYMIHAAGRGAPDYFTSHPIETIDINLASKWMLENCAKNNSQYAYFSSGEVAGHPNIVPTPEDYCGRSLPSDPRSAYIESKRCAEAMCYAYHKEKGVNFKIFRPFIAYGPGIKYDDGRVIPTFIRSALEKNAIFIRSHGDETRAFCYIADMLVEFFKLLATKESDVYNLGNQKEHSIQELAYIIAGQIRYASIGIQHNPFTGAKRVCPDMSKTYKKANYVPQFDLETGIKRTIEYFREVR